jgi:protein tyrosine/serine phosphatase
MKSEKRVQFTTNNFYSILDNLYLSDQIPSFDEEILSNNNIQFLVNLTKTAPFLFKNTNNYHIKFMNNLDSYSDERIVQKIDETVRHIFKLLLNKKGVLIYCENGSNKSLVIVMCFLIKYYSSNNILDINSTLAFVQWKTGKENVKQGININLVRLYRNYLLEHTSDRQRTISTSESSNNTEEERVVSKRGKIIKLIQNQLTKKIY